MIRWSIGLAIGFAPLVFLGWVALSGQMESPSAEPAAAPVAVRSDVRSLPGGALTPALRAELRGLPHLRGPALTEGSLAEKVVLVTFFASWCGPCRVELEHLKTAHEVYSGFGVEVLAVNLFENFDDLSNDRRLAAYLDRLDPPFPVVEGNPAISRAFGQIDRIPTLLIYDRQGTRAVRFVNARGGRKTSLDFAGISGQIERLL